MRDAVFLVVGLVAGCLGTLAMWPWRCGRCGWCGRRWW
jgi:hypothetical protein